MSDEVLPMQSFEAHSRYEAQKNDGILAEMSHYAAPNAWGPVLPTEKYPATTKFLSYPILPVARQADPQSAMDNFGASSQINIPSQALWQPFPKVANVMAYNDGISRLSLAQTSTGPAQSSPMSSSSPNTKLPYHESTTHDTRLTESTFRQTDNSPMKDPKKVGRKRKVTEAEPDSERATYLEKNRQAASKCRNKQRRQQEDLVEQARQVQARNKCLKAEVGMLQHGLRACMEIAAHHQSCPDSRLAIYLQREADRLAYGCLPKSSTP